MFKTISMSWKCKLFRHKWKFSKKKFIINDLGAYISFDIRICQRCYLKQQQELQSGKWFDRKLDKDELRELKLRDLGIK